jgi:hypothetical protein
LLKRTPFYIAILFGLSVLPGCTASEEETLEAAAEPPVAEVDDEAERLRALGYVDFAPDPADSSQSGVVALDPARAQPGHTLVVSSLECAAWLIALDGRELHRWQQQDCDSWWSAALMRSGDLIVNGKKEIEPANAKRPAPLSEDPTLAQRQKSRGRYTARISWAGDVVWKRFLRSHHQIDWTPAGEALMLTEHLIPVEEFIDAVPRFAISNSATGSEAVPPELSRLSFHDNALNWIDADGNLKRSVTLLKAATHPRADFDFVEIETMLEVPTAVGLFHANSAYAMNQPHLIGTDPLYAEGNVLVTSRNQNRIFIVDPGGPSGEDASIIWDWGKDDLSGPHDGTWLANGHLLVFDNGIEREQSRVLEVDPLRKEVVWSYPNGNGAEFNCPTRGMAQRLENGNTLIVNAQDGEAFEVTVSGDRVWHYYIPFLPDNEKRPILVSLKRYSESWIQGKSIGGRAAR